jgi:hypothetical protein
LSDHAQIVVDTEVSAEQARELANIVHEWLVGEQIIAQEQSDSVLGGTGHRPGINYRAAIKLRANTDRPIKITVPGQSTMRECHELLARSYEDTFLDLSVNGVKLAVGRQVFDAGGNGIELQCDGCGVSFKPDDSWSDAVGAWFSGNDLVSFPCPSCGQQALLTKWRGPWPWGFGNLGIEFWNWPPLSDDFIRAITRKLGHRTVMVRLHL